MVIIVRRDYTTLPWWWLGKSSASEHGRRGFDPQHESNFFLRKKGSKVLDFTAWSAARGEPRRPML